MVSYCEPGIGEFNKESDLTLIEINVICEVTFYYYK